MNSITATQAEINSLYVVLNVYTGYATYLIDILLYSSSGIVQKSLVSAALGKWFVRLT